MIRLRHVFATFLLLSTVFVGTHLVSYPGSVAHFLKATGGQKILDMQASASAAETYERLAAMGESGRALYLRLIVTVDIVFPIVMLIFLVTLARFAAQRAGLRRWTKAMLVALPVMYFGFDMLENVSSLAMLLRYPDQLVWVAGAIGSLTRAKRGFMLLALVVPHVLLVLVQVSGWWRARKLQPTA